MDIFELKKELDNIFDRCDDYIVRMLESDGAVGMLCYVKQLSNRQYTADRILKPVVIAAPSLREFRGNFSVLVQSQSLSPFENAAHAAEQLLRGSVLLCIQSDKLYPVLCNADEGYGRTVEEPDTEVTIRGSHAGFVEDMETNLSMLRNFFTYPALKAEILNVGKITKTKVGICYVDGRVKKEIVNEIKRRIEAADITEVLDSGYIELALEKHTPFFHSIGSSEKPDKVAAKLISGRVAIICDGSPFVLTAPYLFAESLQSSEDYVKSPVYSTFIRALRFAAMLISIYLPSIFIASLDGRTRLLPTEFLMVISKSRESLAYGLFGEMLLMLLVFEIIREVGVRMPRAVGSAVGIVGSIILGDAAVKAGIASTAVIIIVALTAISNFVLPPFIDSIIVLRYVYLSCAYLFSFFGLTSATVITLTALCAKKSFGVPYLSPLAPPDKNGQLDFIITMPKTVLGRPEKNITEQQK